MHKKEANTRTTNETNSCMNENMNSQTKNSTIRFFTATDYFVTRTKMFVVLRKLIQLIDVVDATNEFFLSVPNIYTLFGSDLSQKQFKLFSRSTC